MKENIIKEKSYSFSIRIINLFKYLNKNQKENIIARQILRCGTSIGANIEEAIGGSSKKDFINKLSIAYKEARETHYWLRLLYDTGYIPKKSFSSIENDCLEICKILYSILKTSRGNY